MKIRNTVKAFSILLLFTLLTCDSVVVSVISVSVSPSSLNLEVGATGQLVATVAPSNANNKAVTWVSNNVGVATVSSSGEVRGVSAGIATITVKTSDGGFTTTASVAVRDTVVSVTSVSVSPSDLNLRVDSTGQLVATVAPSNANNKAVTWVSNNAGVATVSSSGEVRGVSTGVATITVKTSDGGFTATASVAVRNTVVSVTSVSVSPSSLNLEVGATDQLVATVAPSNANNKAVTWVSNNAGVATVSSSGEVRGVSAGVATITVKTSDGGFTATASVAVRDTMVYVTSVSVSPSSLNLRVGATGQLVATVAPSNANNKAVTWVSNNAGVATVSSSGEVRGVSAGVATITVKALGVKPSGGIVTSSIPVTVTAAEQFSPDDGAQNLDYNKIIFAVEAVSGASSYRWVIQEINANNQVVSSGSSFDVESSGPIDTIVGRYKSGTKYQWYVQAKAGMDVLDTKPVRRFTTQFASEYNNHYYEYRYEYNRSSPGSTWNEAISTAILLGGYLVNINSLEEQQHIKTNLASRIAEKTIPLIVVGDGGNASYVWVGATDKYTEGTWVWHKGSTVASITTPSSSDTTLFGNHKTVFFGQSPWSPASSQYHNWGSIEPDDYNQLQDGGAICISPIGWPEGLGSPRDGSLGAQYQWNDIAVTNKLPYIVEYKTNPTTSP